ncbi:MAG TPA: hypothetical protein VJA19_14045 [Pseudomonas sp.]|nr:hypothetical protein [Pseudomonas sp.]
MNTLLNLLSTAAVVVSGTWAATPPVLQATQATQVQVQPVYRPLAMAPGLVSAAETQGPWVTLNDEGRATGLDPQPLEASQRWIF